MKASARIVALAQPDGSTRLTTLAGESPLLLRRTGRQTQPAPDAGPAGPAQVWFAGGGAGPLGGDALRCAVDLGPGARVDVCGAAPSTALPGPQGRESRLEIVARIGASGCLSWRSAPLIAARGARHRIVSRVEIEPDAALVWREELLLGREGDDPGSVATRLRVRRGERTLLDHELALGPRYRGSLGPAVAHDWRAVGFTLIVDPAWISKRSGVERPQPSAHEEPGGAVAVLPLEGPAVLIAAMAPTGAALADMLDAAYPS